MHVIFIRSLQRFTTSMDIKKYHTDIELCVMPIFRDKPPCVRIGLNDDVWFEGSLSELDIRHQHQNLSAGQHRLFVELFGKNDHDPDQAIQLQSLTLNGIRDQKFIWTGTYLPRYPEPWFSQQLSLGQEPDSKIKNTDYLGWNGIWTLEFTAPIFTWIHQVQGLGWIYN